MDIFKAFLNKNVFSFRKIPWEGNFISKLKNIERIDFELEKNIREKDFSARWALTRQISNNYKVEKC